MVKSPRMTGIRLSKPASYLAGEQGAAFAIALLIVSILFSLAAGVSALAFGESRATPFWRDHGEAYYLAESGLEHAEWKITYDKENIGTTWNEGEYQVTSPSFTSSDASEVAGVLSTGSYYEVWARRDAADEKRWLVTVRADVNGQSHLIHKALRESAPFDGDGTGGFEWKCDKWDDNILVEATDVPLTKEVYWVHSVTTQGKASLVIDPALVASGIDTVYVFVRDSISCTGGGLVNPDGATGSPKLVFIMLPETLGDTVYIAGGTEVYAFIVAGDATVTVEGNSTTIYGAIAGNDVTVGGKASYSEDATAESITWPDCIYPEYFDEWTSG